MRALVYSIILCFLVFTGFFHAGLAGETQYEILLKSRTFTPPEGIFPPNTEKAAPEMRVHAYMQFRELPDLETRTLLSTLGIRLLHYIPRNTWFVSFPRYISPASLHPACIRWVGNIPPEDKIAPVFRRNSKKYSGDADEEALITVRYFRDVETGGVKERLKHIDARVVGEIPEAYRLIVSIPEKNIIALGQDDAVQWVEPVIPSGESESRGIRACIQADMVQKELGLSGRGVAVGVFDNSHVYANHPDLFSRVHRGDEDPAYYRPHSTAVAGLIGGNGSVVHEYRGIAPEVEIFTYSYAARNDSTVLFQNYFTDLYRAVQKQQIDVAHNSWGNRGCEHVGYGEYSGLCAALDSAAHGDFGSPVTIVFSAGNERCVRRYGGGINTAGHESCLEEKNPPFVNYGTINHPKSSKNVLVVGAVDSFDCKMSTYSSWGPTSDGRVKPDLVAPGHYRGADRAGVSEPLGTGSFYWSPQYPDRERRYGYFGLTSCAAAVTSGSIALLLEAYFSKYCNRERPLPSTVRAFFIHTARDLDDSTQWYNRGPDYASGYGLLQIGDAVEQMQSGFFIENAIHDAQQKEYWMEILPDAADVKISLTWDDPPAVENASKALVNDLDIVVYDPKGKRYFPWTLNSSDPSAAAVRTREDDVNNVEQIFIESEALYPGIWQVLVKGTHVPEGPQIFSVTSSVKMYH